MADNWQDLMFNSKPATPAPKLPDNVVPINGTKGTPYGAKALTEECAELAATASGRNHRLNVAAFNLASLVDAGHLDRQQVVDALTNAARQASRLGDHPLTESEIENTIESGFKGSGEKVGARQVADPAPLPTNVTEATAADFPTTQPQPDTDAQAEAEAKDDTPASSFGNHPPIDAATFLFDEQDTTVALWGDGDDILWAEGEALMIAGGMGLGKTTLAGQIVRAQLGLATEVLGLPVHPIDGPILYLAMDRPRQIRRSMLRQFDHTERDHISGRLLIRTGPPIADIAAYPGLLAAMAAEAGAAIVYVDSLKDAAIGLSDDKVGAAYNRARQGLLADGVQICELHHNRKASAGMTPNGSVTEVYGSTWLTSGAGSVITLTGDPGDPIIEFRHVKQPLNEVGPWRLLNNPDAGHMTIDHKVDLLELAAAAGPDGLSATGAAAAIFQKEKPSKAEVEKARYRLDKLARQGLLTRIDGLKGGHDGGTPSVWFVPQ